MEHSIAMLGEPLIAFDITWIIGMLTAVDLDNERSIPAHKINDEGPDRRLSNEFMAV
jgi:hypothetical protein